MNKNQQSALAQTVQMLSQLDPPRFPADQLEMVTMLCLCGKRIPVSDQTIVNTGQVVIPHNLCSSCSKDVGKLPHIVCVKCKRVVTTLKINKDRDGMIFRNGCYYHTESCPVCDPAKRGVQVKAEIFEKQVFRFKNNMMTPAEKSAFALRYPKLAAR